MTAGWISGSAPRRAGVGLRGLHHAEWLEHRPRCGWLEAHAENYFAAGGPLPALLDTLHQDYPLALHGVGLALASTEPLDRDHLSRLAQLVRRHEPELVSEHLCWGRWRSLHFNDLLPLPFTHESLHHVVSRVHALQEALGRQVLIEHLASYLVFEDSSIAEAQFLTELVERSGCGLLLDLNNLHVNATNHGFDAKAFLEALPAAAIGEIHLAGHTAEVVDGESVLIDTHASAVSEVVWQLYRETLCHLGPRPTLIEWDADLPSLDTLLAEASRADAIQSSIDATANQPAARYVGAFETIRTSATICTTATPATLADRQREFATQLISPLAPRGRLSIYHHNRRANFRKALGLTFPVVEKIVGSRFFDGLAERYLIDHPSQSGDLHPIGKDFAAFLADDLAAPGSAFEYLHDVARLEWAWAEALIAADAEVQGIEHLAQFAADSWPRLRMTLHPAVGVIASRWPIHTLVAEQRKAEPGLVHLDLGAETAVVLRRAGVVQLHRLPPAEGRLWLALQAGQALEDALEVASPSTTDEIDLPAALQRLFGLGVVAELSAP